MGKFRFVITLMCALALCASFSLQGIETGKADSTKIVEPTSQNSEKRQQITEVAKHIKFETDTFYLDITLEEAKKQGLAEEAYNMWLERLKVYTKEAREVISKGGHYTYVNTYALPQSQDEQEFEKLSGYIKSTRDTCHLSISLEEALNQGFSERAYRRCAVHAKRHQAFLSDRLINNGDSAKISDRDRPTPQIKEWHRQNKEVAKHIKFDNGICYLDITLEDAQKRGIDENLYYTWLYRIDGFNKAPRKTANPQQ